MARPFEEILAECVRRIDNDGLGELESICAAHPEQADRLRARVRDLMNMDLLAGNLPSTVAADCDAGISERPSRIGPYRILDTLGSGGMGMVYLAEQREPIRRRVALKVIKLGMDSRAVLARFELERQALAVMNHPAIARVFDTGETERGQPYFVMEYVEGVPIDDYCDTQRLSLEGRIRIFQQVCHGIQHAHQKGVLHRDLKPSNILVSSMHGEHVVKIVDFGLARATNRMLTDSTFYTEHGQLIGTPEYMSPEQARGEALAIDTRTDVYSLGVTLYELLTGDLPFPAVELRRAGPMEVHQTLQQIDPPRPSSRVSAAGDRAGTWAKKRQLSVVALRKKLRGDLDFIVMKAMAKEPVRRYESTASLSEDLDRHLKCEPVLAGPPSAGYRLSKVVKKYRIQVMASLVVGLALVAGLITSWSFYHRAEGERQRAEAKAAESNHVADFLEELFEHASPTRSLGTAASVGLLLDQGARRVQRSFGDQPEIKSRLLLRIARSYHWLGDDSRAENLLQLACSAEETTGGPESIAGLESLIELAVVLCNRHAFDDAQRTLSKARARILDLARRDERDRLMSQYFLGMSLLRRRQTRGDDAVDFAERALRLRRSIGDDRESIAKASEELGIALHSAGRFSEAMACFTETLEALKKVNPDGDSQSVLTLHNFAYSLHSSGRNAEAEQTIGRAIAMARQVFGDAHPFVGSMLRSQAKFVTDRNRTVVIEKLLRKALEIHTRSLPAEHRELAWTLNDLGVFLSQSRRFGEAREELRRAVSIYRRLNPNGDVNLAGTLFNLGYAEYGQGQLRAAADRFQEAIDQYDEVDPDGHPKSGNARGHLGFVLMQVGDFSGAVAAYRGLLRLNKHLAVPEGDHWHLVAQSNLGHALSETGREPEGLDLLAAAIAARSRHFKRPNLALAQSQIHAARIAERLGRLDTARSYIENASKQLDELAAAGRPVAREKARVAARRGSLELRAKRFEAAERTLRAAYTELRRVDDKFGFTVQDCAQRLVDLYEARDDPEHAQEFRKVLEVAKRAKPKR